LVLATIFLFACIFAVAFAQDCEYDNGNGMPACNADEAGLLWRNNWDPTRFWSCESGSAEVVICDAETGFSQAAQACVSWAEWEWTPPCNPPSSAA
jgi:hypothetical protein